MRNISFEVSENQLREVFEEFGEVKRLFNLIQKRGMAFVTYVSVLCSLISFSVAHIFSFAVEAPPAREPLRRDPSAIYGRPSGPGWSCRASW